ncbi:MAG TPA: diheme cytochrome c-553 [Puia sp.]
MRKLFIAGGILAFASGIFFTSCVNHSATNEKTTIVMDSAEKVRRGEYLVSIIGCDDCHSPKRLGPMGPEIIPELRLSGYPSSRPILKADSQVVKQGWMLMGADLTSSAGPWGVSFAGNITSDETGIGNWTEENFIRALRQGKYKGLENSRTLLPPMPWFNFKNMSDEDLKSIFAYLKSTKPVSNVVPAARQLAELK